MIPLLFKTQWILFMHGLSAGVFPSVSRRPRQCIWARIILRTITLFCDLLLRKFRRLGTSASPLIVLSSFDYHCLEIAAKVRTKASYVIKCSTWIPSQNEEGQCSSQRTSFFSVSSTRGQLSKIRLRKASSSLRSHFFTQRAGSEYLKLSKNI
ncbi:hypothetical protein COOONC_00287, partial [Cooperia oncophora]